MVDENPHVPAALACNTIVFRAVPYPELIYKNGEHKEKVFIRRHEGDPHGLSVATSIRACKEQFTDRPICGVRSLHVGKLREYGLELFDLGNQHANIRNPDGTNIPSRIEDEISAKNIAADLTALSRPIPYWNMEDADERFQAEYLAKRSNS
jgi:hypothetical protein